MEQDVDAAWRDLVDRLERSPSALDRNPFAAAALLCGLAGLAPLVAPRALPVAFVLGLLALVLGVLGHRAAVAGTARGRRAADAAIVLAAVPLVTCAVVGAVAAAVLAA